MPVSDLRLFHTGVSGMRSHFDKKVEEHRQSQLENPFSEWEGAGSVKRSLSKEDVNYGRPLPGSESERRAQAAQQHIMQEIKYLCDMIWDCAEWRSPDGRAAVSFGKLFNLYIAISDKVVGTLLRARKHGYVYFEGEMLYQRRDDDKVIELARNINTIRVSFGGKPLMTGGGEVEPWGAGKPVNKPSVGPHGGSQEEPIRRRNSTPGRNKLNDEELLHRRCSMDPSVLSSLTLTSSSSSSPSSPTASTLHLPQSSEAPKSSEPIIFISKSADGNNDSQDFNNRLAESPDKRNCLLTTPPEGRSRASSPTPFMIPILEDSPLEIPSTMPSITITTDSQTEQSINEYPATTEPDDHQNNSLLSLGTTSSLCSLNTSTDSSKTSTDPLNPNLPDHNSTVNDSLPETPHAKALRAELVSILGIFSCQLMLSKNDPKVLQQEIQSTADTLAKLFYKKADSISRN